MTEAELDSAVYQLAKLLGIKGYHHRISIGTNPGWVDWVWLGEHGALFREHKSQTGKLSADQRRVGRLLTAAGLDYAVRRPADLRSGLIAAELEAIK